MSETTVKSLGSALVFTCVAWLSDTISVALDSLQTTVFTVLFGGPQAIITGVVAVVAGVIDFLVGTDILAKAAVGVIIFYVAQAFVSIFTLCTFYAITLISPKGTYSLPDCLIAAGIALLEMTPLACSFVFWGAFATYLRRREISGALDKVAQTSGLGSLTDSTGQQGGVGGFLKKAISKFKK